LFGSRQNLLGRVLAEERAIHDLLGGGDHLAQGGLVADDPDIAVEVGDLGKTVVERDQVAQPVYRFQFVVAKQLVGQRDAVDLLAALMELGHPPEDALMFVETEIAGLQGAGNLDENGVVQQNRAEHKPLGIDICRESFLKCDGGWRRHNTISYLRARPIELQAFDRIFLWMPEGLPMTAFAGHADGSPQTS